MSLVTIVFSSSADLPTSTISTKCIKLAAEEEKTGEEEEGAKEKVWPEPPKRATPPVRAAAVLPDDVASPDGCERFSSSENLDPVLGSKLRYGGGVCYGSF